MYVVELGTLECTKVFVSHPNIIHFQKAGDPPTVLKNYEPGDAFGELALLYNAPRAATIVAKNESLCYSLDRNTFNHIVKDAAS